MTIDEAIKHAREVAKDKRADADWKWRHGRLNSDECIVCAEEHEQLAKWLEELKAFKSDDFTEDLLNMGYTKGLKDGYIKAIDEFVEKITLPLTEEDIYRIADEMRGGAK